MFLNSTSVIDNSLHLAYAQWNYPYLFQQVKVVGFLAEIWKTFGYKSVYHQFPYESDSGSETCDGILQSIEGGSMITAAGASSPTLIRSKLFRISLPVYYTSFQFFESSRADDEESTAFSFFAVFSIPALILLILSFAIISSLNYATEKLQKRSTADNQVKTLTLVIYYHAAGFKGNNVMSIPPKTTSFIDLQNGLQTGKRKLITQSRTTIAAAKITVLTRNRTTAPDIVEPDHNALLKKMCDNPNLVTMLERYTVLDRPWLIGRANSGGFFYFEFLNLTISCRIPVPVDSQMLNNFDRTVMQNFMFSKVYTDRRTVERINLVLLKFFDQDLVRFEIETFWTRRYSKTRKIFGDIPQSSAQIDETFRIMSLHRLVPLFYTTAPGWLGSIVVFVCELLISPFSNCFLVRLPVIRAK